MQVQSVVEADIGLLSQIRVGGYREGSLMTVFRDHVYMSPPELLFVHAGLRHLIIYDIVVVSSADGELWSGSNYGSIPLVVKQHHVTLFDRRTRDLRREIGKFVSERRHKCALQVVTDAIRAFNIQCVGGETLNLKDTALLDSDDAMKNIVDFIEIKMFGRTSTIFRSSITSNIKDTPLLALLNDVHVEYSKIIGISPFGSPCPDTPLSLAVVVNRERKTLPLLTRISYIGGYSVAMVQVSYSVDNDEPSSWAACRRVMLSNTMDVIASSSHRCIGDAVMLPITIEQQMATLRRFEECRKRGEIIELMHGRRNYYYPKRWTEIRGDGSTIVSEARYVYSNDLITWNFIDYGGEMSDVLDMSNRLTRFIDNEGVFDSSDGNSLIKRMLPITYERYMTLRGAGIDADRDDIENQKLTELPFDASLDYELSDIASFAHRCGWPYVVNAMIQNKRHDARPVKLIDLIEKTFAWERVVLDEDAVKDIYFNNHVYYVKYANIRYIRKHTGIVTVARISPSLIVEWSGSEWILSKYASTEAEFLQLPAVTNRVISEPWIGMWHNPHNMPQWFDYHNSPQSILSYRNFQESLKSCLGIIVLSEYFAKWVRENIPGVPVSVLFHPTAIPPLESRFSMRRFIENRERCVIQVGYWLRNMCSIGCLSAPGYRKIWLYGGAWAFHCIKEEQKLHRKQGCACSNMEDVTTLRLPDNLYDEMLASNIVFINLYDSSANNAVIECIARQTPLLVNRHPAVVEYLGVEYPFYFDTLEEASAKLADLTLIDETHRYLRDTVEVQDRILLRRYMNDLANCDVVRGAMAQLAIMDGGGTSYPAIETGMNTTDDELSSDGVVL
jgi:hypothetical protein